VFNQHHALKVVCLSGLPSTSSLGSSTSDRSVLFSSLLQYHHYAMVLSGFSQHLLCPTNKHTRTHMHTLLLFTTEPGQPSTFSCPASPLGRNLCHLRPGSPSHSSSLPSRLKSKAVPHSRTFLFSASSAVEKKHRFRRPTASVGNARTSQETRTFWMT
jgi:hypothetical protein